MGIFEAVFWGTLGLAAAIGALLLGWTIYSLLSDLWTYGWGH